MPLCAKAVEAANPSDKPRTMFDGDGLYLLITPNGGKYWRFKYRFGGKEKQLAFGTFPEVSLAAARKKRVVARELVAAKIDPGEEKKKNIEIQKAEVVKAALTFEKIAREFIQNKSSSWADTHTYDVTRKLEVNAFPVIGERPIADIKPPELLKCLRQIEARDRYETTHRVKIIMGQVFRYAASCGHRTDDPTSVLKGALVPVVSKEFPAIVKPKELAGLLRAIDGYTGSIVVTLATIFGSLVVLRPGEMRYGTWDEIDFEAKQWDIPGPRMKMKEPHIVPLSRQALAILYKLKPITGGGTYIFPGARSMKRPLSENGVKGALDSLGYKGLHCAHGWRATFRTIGDEVLKMRVDLLEHQLAHAVTDPLGHAYNRTTFLDERREMMQRWADYLDGLKAGEKVIR